MAMNVNFLAISNSVKKQGKDIPQILDHGQSFYAKTSFNFNKICPEENEK